MQYREISPGTEAQAFVDCYWTLESEASELNDIQRVIPDGCPELILNLDQPFESFEHGRWRVQPRCFLVGQITGPLLIRPHGRAKIFGVRFRPHGAAQLLNLPMKELTGLAVPIDDLSPELARELDRSLEPAGARAIESALVRHANVAEDPIIREAVRQIVEARGARDVARLAAHLGISLRQLERRFENRVGLSPKLFGRIQRFRHVFHEIDESRPDWVDAAVACGYYDQAHLIRDFRDFSGKTPAVLLADTDLARHFVREMAVSNSYNTAVPASR